MANRAKPPREKRFPVPAVIGAAAAIVTVALHSGNTKVFTLLCCLLCAAALLLPRAGRRFAARLNAATAALTVYIIVCGLGILWAVSGKFLLKEFSRLLICFTLYVCILAFVKKPERAAKSIAFALSACCALLATLSVDLATLGLSAGALELIPGFSASDAAFEAGARLTGIFGNANILSGTLAIGVLLSLYLVDSAEDARRRILPAAMLSLSAFSFLLAFSMGGTAVFIAAVLTYLAAAGKRRGSALLHMLTGAVPTAAFVFASFPFFGRDGAARAVPLLCMAAGAVCCCVLEAKLFDSALAVLSKRARSTGLLTAAVLALVAVYAAAGLLWTGPYGLKAGETLRRVAYPEPGENSLRVSAEGEVYVSVRSQSMPEVMMHVSTTLYEGPADGASFTVPEDSEILQFYLSSKDGARLDSAALATGESLRLKYKLLPGFIVNRLQGVWANQNAIQRTVFFRDGMKLFAERPLLGNGLGSFESAAAGVQEFYYETKYVHNHYIQVLLDSGLLGFAAYMAFLAFSVIALIKKRREISGPLAPLYPALCACMVMICGHSAVEVVMSVMAFLPTAFTVFALVSLCFAEPVKGGTAVRAASLLAVSVYAVLIALNISAASKVERGVGSYGEFYPALDTAISRDVFERNDYLLSYVVNAPDSGSAEVSERAASYAERLMGVRSNSIHVRLVSYYLALGDGESAVKAAEAGCEFNRANPEVWSACFGLLGEYLINGGEDADGAVAGGIAELYQSMLLANEKLMAPIEPDEFSRAVFEALKIAQD